MAEFGLDTDKLELPLSHTGTFDRTGSQRSGPLNAPSASDRALNALANSALRTPRHLRHGSTLGSLNKTGCSRTAHGSTLGEDMGLLWQGGPGTIQASPSSFIQDDPQEQQRMISAVRFWMVWMIVTGGGVDYVVDVYNDIVHNLGFSNEVTVFVVTAMSFLASATPPTFSKADRQSVREVNAENPYFKWKVQIPGLLDLVITTMRFAAILFISPAIVSMLKTSTQLVTLTMIQHLRGKKITWKMALCLLGCVLGLGVVSFGEITDAISTGSKNVALGLALAISSGVIGSVRNVLEEVILQGDDLSTGGLMLAESWISLVGLVIVTSVQQASNGALQAFFQEVGSVLSVPIVWVALTIIMCCTYCKDFGKLFITKHGSALIAKVLTMMFPIVTWVCSLLTFVASDGQFGEGLAFPESIMRLLGFVIIATSSITFVLLQKKK